MRACTLIVVSLLGCTKAGAPEPVNAQPPQGAATVAITSVNLTGDCHAAGPTAAHEGEADADMSKQSCEGSSVQLSVVGPSSGAQVQIRIKRIELFDDKGKLIGAMTPRTPTTWSQDGTYKPWDQSVAPAQSLSVSYRLSPPNWAVVANPWDHTYVLKAVITIGASDQTVQREVQLDAPSFLPPDVET